jgi:hypothetical protein
MARWEADWQRKRRNSDEGMCELCVFDPTAGCVTVGRLLLREIEDGDDFNVVAELIRIYMREVTFARIPKGLWAAIRVYMQEVTDE